MQYIVSSDVPTQGALYQTLGDFLKTAKTKGTRPVSENIFYV